MRLHQFWLKKYAVQFGKQRRKQCRTKAGLESFSQILDVCHLPASGIKCSGMIQSFRCADTQYLFETGKSKKFGNINDVAERKLTQLAAAAKLEFLKSPPGNHLERLTRDRDGQYSIRINQQWRICFVWGADGPADVETVDCH